MQIDGQGSTFVFALRGGRVHLQSCRNVTLKNLFLDMDHPPFIQGTIRAIDQAKKTIDFAVDDGFPSLDQAAFPPGKVRHVIMDSARDTGTSHSRRNPWTANRGETWFAACEPLQTVYRWRSPF